MSEKRVAILHISDLHITDNKYHGQKRSKLQDENYLEEFGKKIKGLFSVIELKYMIISGDITDRGKVYDFAIALKIINKICEESGINKKNVMILPGNHDIDWGAFEDRLRELNVGEKEYFYKYNDEKLQEFKKFYDDFFEGIKEFDPNKAVFDSILIEEKKVLFLGINTIYRESHLPEDHIGYINEDKLRKELESYKEELENNTVFGVMHHSPRQVDKEPGTIENWQSARICFEKKKINKFICGHSHVSNAFSVRTTDYIEYVNIGSLGLDDKGILNTFLILEENENNEKKRRLKPKYYGWIGEESEREYWQELSEKKDTLDFIEIEKEVGSGALSAVVNSIDCGREALSLLSTGESNNESRIWNQMTDEDEYNVEIKKFLLDTIRANDLYMSGHFHWSNNGRSHSFIKTNYFFENYTCLEKIKIAFLNLLNKNNVKTDLLIGYAMQGSVIGSLIAIEKEWEYSYCPAIAKKHSEYEKKLPEGDYQNITIIIDLVYTDNIVKWLVETIKKQYSSLTKISICTLFYTDYEDFTLKQHEGVKIDFFYIYKININKCPYKDMSKCVIYKERLDNVHILYSEEEEQ